MSPSSPVLTCVRLVAVLALLAVLTARAEAEEDPPPYQNEVVIVPGERISEAAALRIIKGGLSAPRSSHAEHADRIVCRIEATTGTRCKHLWCSTNGELDRIRDTSLSRFNSLSDAIARGGMVEVRSGPDPGKPPCMNTAKLERALAELTVPDAGFVAVQQNSLRRFAEAYPRVRDIQEAFDRRMADVRDRHEMLRLQQQADAEMATAIEESDLDVAEYNRMALRVSRDDDLRARVSRLLDGF